jgi:hypothetical protein
MLPVLQIGSLDDFKHSSPLSVGIVYKGSALKPDPIDPSKNPNKFDPTLSNSKSRTQSLKNKPFKFRPYQTQPFSTLIQPFRRLFFSILY